MMRSDAQFGKELIAEQFSESKFLHLPVLLLGYEAAVEQRPESVVERHHTAFALERDPAIDEST